MVTVRKSYRKTNPIHSTCNHPSQPEKCDCKFPFFSESLALPPPFISVVTSPLVGLQW